MKKFFFSYWYRNKFFEKEFETIEIEANSTKEAISILKQKVKFVFKIETLRTTSL